MDFTVASVLLAVKQPQSVASASLLDVLDCGDGVFRFIVRVSLPADMVGQVVAKDLHFELQRASHEHVPDHTNKNRSASHEAQMCFHAANIMHLNWHSSENTRPSLA